MRLSTAVNKEEGTWPCSSFPYGADNTRSFINPSLFSGKQSEVQLEQTWTPGKRHCTVRQVFSSPSTLEVLSLKYFLYYDTSPERKSPHKGGTDLILHKGEDSSEIPNYNPKIPNRFTLKAFHKNNC